MTEINCNDEGCLFNENGKCTAEEINIKVTEDVDLELLSACTEKRYK